MKKVPSNFEERLKLPAEDFADPENRVFPILSKEDLIKLPGRIKSLSNKDEIKKNALQIAAKNNIDLPEEVLAVLEK